MDFSELNGKKIFLTGGTGFFGKSILSLLKRGFLPDTKVVVLSRHADNFIQKYPEFANIENVGFISGDVRNFPFPKQKFDYIIHAATPAVTTLPPGEMENIIIDGMAHILDFAKVSCACKLLFTSSGAVYGNPSPPIYHISENCPCNPVTEYGIAKLKAEQMCMVSGFPTVIARCFAFTGPYLNREIHYAIGNFINNGVKGEPIIIKGDGTPRRSYMYADDLVVWLLTILIKGQVNCPYNVGSDYAVSIAQLAKLVAQFFTPEPEVKILGKAVPGTPEIWYVPDITHAKTELGLSITTTLSQSIAKTIEQGK